MNTENHYQETDLGNISIHLCGEYDPQRAYEYLDAVEFGGGSYICAIEYGKTITGIAPEPTKNTEYWHINSIPGTLTPEYIAMHDRVVNISEQVEADAEEVRTAEQNVSGMELNVTQMQEQTRQSAEAAEKSKDSAAGYAASADASRQAAETSEQNINAQVTGFDAHVDEKTSESNQIIEAARIAANKAILAQQEQSVNEVARVGGAAVSEAQTAARVATEKAQAAAASEKNAAASETAAKLSETNATKMAEQVATDKEQVAYDRTAVENAKQEMTGSVAQIEQNTQGITELKGDIYTSSEFYYPVERGTFDSNGKVDSAMTIRIRTDSIEINKGDSILIKNGNLEHSCAIWKDSIIDSNCIRLDTDNEWYADDEEIYCEYDGYLIVVYRNKSNTDLSLSDFDGEIKIEKSQILKNMRNIDKLKRKTSLYSSKNLCGMDSNILYPVDLKIGDILTLSTSDSSLVGEDFDICLFDENKKLVDRFSLVGSTNKRTIELVKDAKYITWGKKCNIPLQIERGDTATSYEEYIYQPNELKSVIDKGYYELTPFTNGSWTNNNLTFYKNRLRLQDFVQVKSGDKIKIKNGSFYHCVGLWDSSMNLYRDDNVWYTDDEEIDINCDGYAIIVFKKPTNEDISYNDFDGEIKLYNIYGSEKEEIIIGNDELIIGNKKIAVYNPYKDKKKNKYKGQLHCHTTNSDGKWSVDKTMTKYSEAGYDFITITDHNFITEEPTDLHGMVWIGNSLEDTNNRAGYQHCNIIGAKSVVGKIDKYTNSNTVASMIKDYVKDQGAIIQYNHPDDPVVYVSNNDLDNMPNGISLIEIYNSCDIAWKKTVSKKTDLPLTGNKLNDMFYCEEDGKKYFNNNFQDSMTNVWEVTETREPVEQERGFVHLLDAGKKVFGTATDDCHFECTFNYGWVQVFANSRSKNAIMNGLLSGNFYASCGVELSDISVEDGQYIVNVENGENAIITFYGEGMKVLKVCNGTNAVYEFDGTEKYVRATIQIGDNKAWTQPVWLLSKKYNYEF